MLFGAFTLILIYHQLQADALIPINVTIATGIINNLLYNDAYRKEIAPIEGTDAITLNVTMKVLHMVPQEFVRKHFTATFILKMEWIDFRLRYKTDWNESSELELDAEAVKKLWVPSIFFPYAKKTITTSSLAENIKVTVYENGTVVYSERLSVLTHCDMNFSYYPFDIQNCDFLIGLYSYTNDYIKLNWGESPHYDDDKKHAETVEFKKIYIQHSGRLERSKYDKLRVTFKFYRNQEFFLLRYFLPSILTVTLSWVSFWINYKATPARISFGITSVLTIITLTNNVYANTPNSSVFRSIDIFLLVCCLFVFGVLVEYAVVGLSQPKLHEKSIYKRRKSRRKKDKVAAAERQQRDNMVINVVEMESHERQGASNGKIATISHKVEEERQRNKSLRAMNKPTESQSSKHTHIICGVVIVLEDQHVIDRVSAVLFPVAFFIFNVGFFLFHKLSPDTVV